MNDKYRMLTKIVRNLNLKKNRVSGELNYNEAEALRYISKHDGCIQKNVVDYLNVDKGFVTRVIKKLESNGYIFIKIKEDKRMKYLYITKKGLDYKMNTQLFEEEYYKSLFVNIEDEEKDRFFDTLYKIYSVSKAKRKEDQK